jgi:hypothetical protein
MAKPNKKKSLHERLLHENDTRFKPTPTRKKSAARKTVKKVTRKKY